MNSQQAPAGYRGEPTNQASYNQTAYDESPEDFRRNYGNGPVVRIERPKRGTSKTVLAVVAGFVLAAAAICGLVFAGHSSASPSNSAPASSSSSTSSTTGGGGGVTPAHPSRPDFISGVPTPSWLPQNPVG